MQKKLKKALGILTLSGVLFLNSCSGETVKETTVPATPESTQSFEQTLEQLTLIPKNTEPDVITTTPPVTKTEISLARVIKVPYDDENVAVFTFNEKGLLISSENCPWGTDNDYYTYDEQNRITEIQHTLSNGTIDDNCERKVYTYDENGNITKCVVYTGSKEQLVRFRVFEYEYNNSGLLTKETLLAGGNNKLLETNLYEYNENGKLIKSQWDSYGSVSETVYTYNENGDVAQTVETYKNTEYINTYTYEYDENGNATKCTTLSETKEYDDSHNVINESTFTEEIKYTYKNGIKQKEFSDKNIDYEYYDNHKVVAVYWGGKESPEEINIYAVPEVMGNFEDLPY